MKLFAYVVLTCVCLLASATSVWAAPIVADSFSTTWDTGDSSIIRIDLGVCPDSVYWEELNNDINSDTSFSCVGSETTVTFPYAGQYRVDFSGSFTRIRIDAQFDKDKFRTVEQWGSSSWTNLSSAFANVTDLAFNAVDVPDLSNTTSLFAMFRESPTFNSPLDTWDVSNVTDIAFMFEDATSFDQPLDTWDVSSVTDMRGVFLGATSFNQPLNSWNVSSVTSMSAMFAGATSFNQPLNNWDVSGVTSFTDGGEGDSTGFLEGATAFNQSLGEWTLRADGIFAEDLLNDTAISSANYAATLQGWAALVSVPSNVNLDEVSTAYCDTAQAAWDSLTGTYSWTINDLGPVTCVDDEEEVDDDTSTGGSSATRVGDREKRLEALRNQASTTDPATNKSFGTSVRELIDFLTLNEDELTKLTPEQSKQVIVTLRDIIVFLLKFIPGI